MSKLVDSLKNFIFRRQHAYKVTFDGPLAEEVLRDLATFCRAAETTFHEDERVGQALNGRREVWLRIQNHLKLTQDEIYELVTGAADSKTIVVQSEDSQQ